MNPGLAVWAVLGGAVVAWTALSALRPGLPDLARTGRALLGAWLGRLLLLAGWAAAGWHLFCQRP